MNGHIYRLYLVSTKNAKGLRKVYSCITSELQKLLDDFRSEKKEFPILKESPNYGLIKIYFKDYLKNKIDVCFWKEGDAVPLKTADVNSLITKKLPDEEEDLYIEKNPFSAECTSDSERKKLTRTEQELEKVYFTCIIKETGFLPCIEWAMSQLEKGNDEDNICILAGLDQENPDEIVRYVQKIIGYYSESENKAALEKYAACCLKELAEDYFKGKIKPGEFSVIAEGIYINAEFPSWMEKFTKNNEYGVISKEQKRRFEASLRTFLGECL